ncbi:hypothetical protein JTE90_001803 [Oedothorax gibbosus]|uniref:Uncharacterized protein n=1 Tax=Oedothorax gibbosus TaxID=931172 RepID=A0AAV6VTC7_9ARAC|nr:hypothetical protein JTE90_001803 [Oedothorax gibbosus]
MNTTSSPSKTATPIASRTKSLRERFSSKRSYSENFKDPPVPSPSSPSKDACRSVRPSLPIIGVAGQTLPVQDPQKIYNPYAQPQSMQMQQQRKQARDVLSEHYNPFAVLPEETYCSALDINSQEGDPRFPWQRDAAVQCDLSPDIEGHRFTRRDSFFMLGKDAADLTKTSKSPLPTSCLPSFTTDLTSLTAGLANLQTAGRDDLSKQLLAERFKEGYWHNLSICNEEEEPPDLGSNGDDKNKKKKKKTSMLQRALSERTRSRRLTYQTTTDEPRLGLPTNRIPGPGSEREHRVNPAAEMPASTYTKPTDVPVTTSPQTPPPPASSSPSRRNSRRRGFVRKNTQSAPDSFDNDDGTSDYSAPPVITMTQATPEQPTAEKRPVSIGYFNFDSMQRLLDLSITASTKAEKPSSFLLTPGGKGFENAIELSVLERFSSNTLILKHVHKYNRT